MAEKNRRAHAEKIQPQRTLAPRFPKAEHRPDCGDKENRIQERAFGEQKIPEVAQRRMPVRVESGVSGDVLDGDPMVLRVPNNHGQSTDQKNEQGEPRAAFSQMDSRGRPKREENREANYL